MIISQRYFVLIGLLVAAPVSAWAIAYRPMNHVVHKVSEEIRIRSSCATRFEEINEKYRKLRALTKNINEATSEARSRVPSEHGADQWLESASETAQNLGLVVRSVTTSGQRVEGEYVVLPIDMYVSGTFENVYMLLQHFERMNYFSRVDRMNIHRVGDNVVEARVVVHLIYSAEGEK